MSSEKNKNNIKETLLGLFTIGLIVLLVISLISVFTRSEGRKLKFESSIADTHVVDSSTLRVSINVKNIGSIAGSPKCSIRANGSSSAYNGFDTFEPGKILSPGETWGFSGNITVTNQGAEKISNTYVECK